jgi:hypothetical protein
MARVVSTPLISAGPPQTSRNAAMIDPVAIIWQASAWFLLSDNYRSAKSIRSINEEIGRQYITPSGIAPKVRFVVITMVTRMIIRTLLKDGNYFQYLT